MENITITDLKEMKPSTVFAKGVLNDSPEGINLANTGNDVRWVAKRGDIHDWTIYAQNPHYGELEWSYEKVETNGDKIISTDNILKLINATPEALEMYRY